MILKDFLNFNSSAAICLKMSPTRLNALEKKENDLRESTYYCLLLSSRDIGNFISSGEGRLYYF